MDAKKLNLREWFYSLNELERLAITQWIADQNPELIFAFASSSEVLQKLTLLIRSQSAVEEVL